MRKPLTKAHGDGNLGLKKTAELRLNEEIAIIKKLRNSVNSAQNQIDKINLVPSGEREAFIEFSARSGQQFTNSWEVLAAMQHCGVPTRLLDWSETLSTALFFALRIYTLKLEKIWSEDKKAGRSGPFARTPFELRVW